MKYFLKCPLLTTTLAVCVLSFAGTIALASDDEISGQGGGPHELSVYAPVPGLDPSPHYRFRVRQVEASEWMEPFAWLTKCVSSEEGAGTKYYSDFIGGWSQTYCNFEIGEGVLVEVEITRLDPDTGEAVAIETATPHPRRKVRSWRVEDGKAYVIIDQPALFAVDIDGQMDENNAPRAALSGSSATLYPFLDENAIHTVTVFANPFITDKPDPNDPSVYVVQPGEPAPETGDWDTLYFAPGVHQLFEGELMDEYYEGFDFQLKSNKNYYIPGDAIVYGHLNTRDHLQNAPWPALKENIRVFGHGTISGARTLHPEDMEIPYSHIWSDEGRRFRSLEIRATGSIVEGVTFADSANHTMNVNTRGHHPLEERPANYARWLKVITWRANGDGITMLGNGYLEDSFIRAQDDGTYVRGLGIRRNVYWNDVNGTALRNTFLMNDRGDDYPASLPQTLYVEDIDIIYGRGVFHTDNSRYSVIQKQSFRQTDNNDGSHVVFRNINYEDPNAARSLFGFDVRVDRGTPDGSLSGVRFENIRAASPSAFDRPNTFWGNSDSQISNLIFDNVVLAGRQFNSMGDFVHNQHAFDFVFENTEPQDRTYLNTSGYGKWYIWDDWAEGLEPADHDIVHHTEVADTLIVDGPAYAGSLNISHADAATVQIEKGATLAVSDSVSLGGDGESGHIRLVDGTLELVSDDASALAVSNGTIHFDEGSLRWAGDQINTAAALANSGVFSLGSSESETVPESAVIIALGGSHQLLADYDEASDSTTVWLVASEFESDFFEGNLEVDVVPTELAGSLQGLVFDGTELQINGAAAPENLQRNTRYYEVVVNADGDGSADSTSLNARGLDLIPGQDYRLAFRVKASAVGEVDLVVETPSLGTVYAESVDVTTDWQTHEVVFFLDHIPDEGVDLRFLLGGNGDGFEFGLDQVSLSPADTNPRLNNVLSNGDFEGAGDDWVLEQTAGSDATGGIQTLAESSDQIIALSGLELKANRQYNLEIEAQVSGFVDADVTIELRRARAQQDDGQVYATTASIAPTSTTIIRDFHSGSHFGNDLEIVLHLDALAPGQSLEVFAISLQEEPGSDPGWVRQGTSLSLTSDVPTQVLLLPYYFPLDRHFSGGLTAIFSDAKLNQLQNEFGAKLLPITDDTPLIVDTSDLRSGGYEIHLLSSTGLLLDSKEVHIAFDQLSYSRDYRVSIQDALGRTYSIDTFDSRREPFYVRGGLNSLDFSRFDSSRDEDRLPVMAHSFANISTDAYPIEVTVQVLDPAGEPFFDGAPGMTLPLVDASVLPSSKGVEPQVSSSNTITFTLDSAEKVMVLPNHDQIMAAIEARAAEGYAYASFEDKIGTLNAGTWGNILDDIGEGFKNPLVILAREPNPLPEGVKDDESSTLVVRSGDRPTQEDLDSRDIIWFEGGAHDLSRLGEFPHYRTYIRPGQTWYFEENAFLAAGINASDRDGTILSNGQLSANGSAIIGHGTITGINHFWGAGLQDLNSAVAHVTQLQGMNVTDRAEWGIEGGSLIEDVALLGAWHPGNQGLNGLDGSTVRDVLLMAHGDNLHLGNGTIAEQVITYMTGPYGRPILFRDEHRTFENGDWPLVLDTPIPLQDIRVSDVDILAHWDVVMDDQNGWSRLSPGVFSSVQTFPVDIENALFSGIRVETPYLYRIFGFYNAYSDADLLENHLATTSLSNAEKAEVRDLTYLPDRLLQSFGSSLYPRIQDVTFENISVKTEMISHRSLLGSAFEDSIDGFEFTNVRINEELLSDVNFDEHFELSGYRNATGLGQDILQQFRFEDGTDLNDTTNSGAGTATWSSGGSLEVADGVFRIAGDDGAGKIGEFGELYTAADASSSLFRFEAVLSGWDMSAFANSANSGVRSFTLALRDSEETGNVARFLLRVEDNAQSVGLAMQSNLAVSNNVFAGAASGLPLVNPGTTYTFRSDVDFNAGTVTHYLNGQEVASASGLSVSDLSRFQFGAFGAPLDQPDAFLNWDSVTLSIPSDEPLLDVLSSANWGESAGERIEVTLPTTLSTTYTRYYDAWAARAGITGGPLDDDSGSGMSNLAQLALGGKLPRLSASEGSLTLHFKTLDKPDLPFRYILESSSDLTHGSWAPHALPIVLPHGSAFGEYVDSEMPLPVEGERMFYRLRIEQD